MVLSKQVGMAMAAQVSRVNSGGRSTESAADTPDVYEQLRQAQTQIRLLKAQLKALESKQPPGISLSGHALTTPKVFADMHRVSVATVNRALNDEALQGIRQPNGRWLVVTDQSYTPKRKRD